jgi:hypothetical protein
MFHSVGIALISASYLALVFAIIVDCHDLMRRPTVGPSRSTPALNESVAKESITGFICRNMDNAACARQLTDLYIAKRFADDLVGIQGLLSPEVTVSVDLKHAGWLVSWKVNVAMGYRASQSGRSAVAGFYHALRPGNQDAAPRPEDVHCTDDQCTFTVFIQRPMIGTVQDVGTLRWDLERKQLRQESNVLYLL